MLEQVQQSINQELQKKKMRCSSANYVHDFSVVAEYDPSFPDLDGHPQSDSLLHEIDENLVRGDYSDNDAEMDDDDPHTVNVGWVTNRSEGSASPTHHSKKTKRRTNPEKAQKQQATQEAAAAKKEEKRLEAKAKRDESIFHRRVLEANNGRNGAGSETEDDPANASTTTTRTRRVSSGISASWTGFYGVNLALNQAQLTNTELITGCADMVLGGVNSSSSSSRDITITENQTEADYSVVLSYRKQSGAVCDRVLKQ
jgi:hypothetical protein